MNKRLFIVVNVDRFLLSHRLPVALAAAEAGYDVHIVTKDTGLRAEIESHGLKFIDVPFDRTGTNPFHELKCVLRLWRLYRSYKPDVIHHVSLKACLLGCLAAKLSGRKRVVNAISGFGYSFTGGRDGLVQKALRCVMPVAFKSRNFHYIFQNPDDAEQFRRMRYAREYHIHIIKGSGVDLREFAHSPETAKPKVRVILPARMLYDKGVMEFIEAAELIRDKAGDSAEFVLAGNCDTQNPAGIPESVLRGKMDGGYIRWIGFCDDMYSALKESDIVVLPSYREGLPKSLIEACAVGRPIVTTDAIGCRECVDDGWNGYIIPVKDPCALAEKMQHLISDRPERERMGNNGRLLAEREFSIDNVVEKHLDIYNRLHDSSRLSVYL